MAHVLVVEDDPSLLEVVCKYLEKSGFSVEGAPHGRNALERTLRRAPDVMIVDLLMPHMDGCHLLEILRSYFRLRELPVIVLTGLSDSPMINRVRNMKVKTVLQKGKVTMDQIVEAVKVELEGASN